MIHELIDPKKKVVRSSNNKQTKTVSEPKTFSDVIAFEQSDSENKEAESSSTTFIPPWLRNSLGLNQRNNQSHVVSDQKQGRIISKFKDQNQNEFDSLKENLEDHLCPKESKPLENLTKNPGVEAICPSPGSEQPVSNYGEKPLSVFWRRKGSETESNCTNAEINTPRGEEGKVTSTDGMTSLDIGKLKDEERKRLRFLKQKNKLRKRIMNEHKGTDMVKNEVDFLLEMKAREVLDNYMKKEVHSVSSEMKQLEAKLILLSAKCHDADHSKLTQQEMRLLQEIKNQAGNKEGFEKLINHVKESNLKEILRNSEILNKALGDRITGERNVRNLSFRYNDDSKSNADKESLVSTDDENDIKRFSEFLSKNKNMEEKRKCLEEVRNYFERKRRTRLIKRRDMGDSKTPRQMTSDDRKEEHSKNRSRTKDIISIMSSREKKSKFGLCDEEIVEKAVNETLQKFVELYHFHVSPTMMGSMKKNILQAIQSDSLDSSHSKQNFSAADEFKGVADGKKSEKFSLVKANINSNDEADRKNQESCTFTDVENIVSKDTLSGFNNGKDKKRTFKTLVESTGDQTNKISRETENMENENIKRLKKEFQNFLNSIQVHADITGLKLQSIILEKEEQSAPSKSLQFVYNFTKKALESNKVDFDSVGPVLKDSQDSKNRKDSETQTMIKSEASKKNAKCQTVDCIDTCEQCLQTDQKTCVSSDAQTESEDLAVKEIKDLKEFDVSPGLYRMVKSKEVGRFYLYPEKIEDSTAKVFGDASVFKVPNPKEKREKKKESIKVLAKEKSSKEKRISLKDKERGKLRRNKRPYILNTNQTHRLAKKEMDEAKEMKNSINCLYFRKFQSNASGPLPKELPPKENYTYNEGATLEEVKKTALESHLGCVWFWDGERISQGCDLKAHVEDLLKEKLKEITCAEAQKKSFVHEGDFSNTVASSANTCQVVKSKSSERNLEIRNTNAIFCFRSAVSPQGESAPLAFSTESSHLEYRNKAKGDEIAVAKKPSESVEVEGKSVRNVGTQNSQQTFLSLNITKLKPRSRSRSVIKSNKDKQKKKKVVAKPERNKEDEVWDLKKTANVMKAMKEIKKMKFETENSGSNGRPTPESFSTLDETTSSSVSKNDHEDPFSVILGLKNNPNLNEVSNLEVKNKIRKIISLVDHEVQTKEADDFENENSTESQTQEPGMGRFKHWELIESVLNRVNQKERESLWNDIREFIKTKIGRDINDEGAREVCIEIEQDMPNNDRGKAKHAILAKGHYTRNEGDVEVEIDLTLDDLERILRHRQKKIRRRQICHASKTKKFLSSSSGLSDFTKDELRKYHKYLHKFTAPGGRSLADKDLTTSNKK